MGILEDKVALITGGSSGQGAAEARLFAAEGASVVIADIDSRLGESVAADLGARALFLYLDVADEPTWQNVVAATTARFGGIDILINNAGVSDDLPFQETDLASYSHIQRVNLLGPFLGMKAVFGPMSGGGGCIINIGSAAGLRGIAGKFSYGVSKWGLRGLTRYAAHDLAPFNIRVNAILPGIIDTPLMNRSAAAARLKSNLNVVPLHRIGTPMEIAKVALFLASDASSYMTGAEMVVDGGLLA